MKLITPRPRSRRTHTLRLPELEHCRTSVLNSLVSAESRRSYKHAMTEFISWYCSEPRLALNRIVVLHYRQHLESRLLAATTINVRLAAVRRLANEAADAGLLSADLAAGIRRVKGAKRLGCRAGNWLTKQQGQDLLNAVRTDTLRGKRDAAVVALLLGCGLRRSELVALEFGHIQRREDHWVIIDLVGKGGRVRSVSRATLGQTRNRQVDSGSGCHFRTPVSSHPEERARVGQRYYAKCRLARSEEARQGCGIDRLAPHDLRRSCARLCHAAGGELEQIQFLLGHSSVQTTERYIGCKQKFGVAVNDRLVLFDLAA